MFVSIFDDVRSLVGSKTASNLQPEINSVIFASLRITTAITAISCVLVTSRNYIGDNINCYSSGTSDEEMKAVESYCFISSTFTLSNLTLPAESAHPGLGPVPRHEYFPPGSETATTAEGIQHHSYYQWVPFLLALQSVLLYLPCIIWNSKEDGYLNQILGGTNKVNVDIDSARKSRERSAGMFKYSMLHNNWKYLAWFLICETLGTVSALVNLFITNHFLSGKFFYYGEDAIKYLRSSATDENNPLNQVFPKVGKCTWYTFGASGSIQSKDALCVLPLNIVNEKIYVALWLAYISLCAVTAAALLYHVALFVIPQILGKRVISRAKESSAGHATKHVVSKCDKADTFILWNLQEHIVNFPAWIEEVLADIKGQ